MANEPNALALIENLKIDGETLVVTERSVGLTVSLLRMSDICEVTVKSSGFSFFLELGFTGGKRYSVTLDDGKAAQELIDFLRQKMGAKLEIELKGSELAEVKKL